MIAEGQARLDSLQASAALEARNANSAEGYLHGREGTSASRFLLPVPFSSLPLIVSLLGAEDGTKTTKLTEHKRTLIILY